MLQADGAVASAKANVAKAESGFERVSQLAKTDIESKQAQDDARLGARSRPRRAQGSRKARTTLAQTYVDWCTIRSPINGVVLEKLVDPNELVDAAKLRRHARPEHRVDRHGGSQGFAGGD